MRYYLALLLLGCTVDPPDGFPTTPTTPISNQSHYADAVYSIVSMSTTTDCTSSFPDCTAGTPQGGPCAGNAALGPNDGKTFDLGPLDRIELGFYCSTILEVGGTGISDDFKIWGTVDAGAQPRVEVSMDGITYFTVNLWPMSAGVYAANPGFQLEVAMLSQARFVRISELNGAGAIHVDAIEAFPVSQ